MINRRIIRTKVLQILYAFYSSEESSLSKAENELFFCINKTYELYHFLFALIIEIADYAEQRIEIRKNKHQPTADDLNPNTKFIDNRVITQLRNNKQLNSFIRQKKLSWVNHPALIKDLYLFLTESDFYIKYMDDKDCSYYEDKKFIEKVLNKIILITEDLYEVLEEQSIYWNDDIDYVISMITKTVKSFREHSSPDQPLLPIFRDIDDQNFAKELLRKSIINHTKIRELIKIHSHNWDLERIAFMDILIMQLSITEFLYFPSIPTKVSLNEYIELSKFYSTDRSRNFINGILDKALKDLKTKGLVIKSGRGLVGET